MNKIALTTSSFAVHSQEPLAALKTNGFTWAVNPHGRTLKQQETIDLLSGCLGVVAGTEIYDEKILSYLPELKIISRCGVGTDAIDLEAVRKRGIKLLVTPDAPVQAVAELVIGLAFNLVRQVTIMDRDMRRGQWNKRAGLLLEGKRLGLIGFGRIGQRVATLAAALGIIVRYYDPFAEVSGKDQRQTHSLRELLSQSDIVSIHVPLSSETRALMGAEQFKAMNKGAYLIQCSRGGVIDEEGLYEALDSGHLAGAALDVFETEPYSGPLKNLDNVILLPHIGSYAQETRMRMEMEAVNNLIHQWHLLRS